MSGRGVPLTNRAWTPAAYGRGVPVSQYPYGIHTGVCVLVHTRPPRKGLDTGDGSGDNSHHAA